MKTKHIAIAIALAAASLSAHADLARVGPTNLPSPAGHGFPIWYQDLNGMVLDLCLPDASDPGALQQNACLLVGPGLPDPPYSFPTNFPDEAFYFNATSVMDMPSRQEGHPGFGAGSGFLCRSCGGGRSNNIHAHPLICRRS